MKDKAYLSIEEKRAWLADIFRDVAGEYSQADKFKAMVEDTKLAQILDEQSELELKREQEEKKSTDSIDLVRLLQALPPPSLVSAEKIKGFQ